MTFEVIVLAAVRLIRAHHLFIEALDLWRKKSVQAKLLSFLFCEGGAFVQPRPVQEIHPGWEIV
jgi:hypothetical protein